MLKKKESKYIFHVNMFVYGYSHLYKQKSLSDVPMVSFDELTLCG